MECETNDTSGKTPNENCALDVYWIEKRLMTLQKAYTKRLNYVFRNTWDNSYGLYSLSSAYVILGYCLIKKVVCLHVLWWKQSSYRNRHCNSEVSQWRVWDFLRAGPPSSGQVRNGLLSLKVKCWGRPWSWLWRHPYLWLARVRIDRSDYANLLPTRGFPWHQSSVSPLFYQW